MKKLIAILILAIAVQGTAQAQFGKLLNKAKEAVKKATTTMTGDPQAKVAAEAAEDLPAIYSIARYVGAFGPDSNLDNELYPQLAFSLRECIEDIKKGKAGHASANWDLRITKIMGWVKQRDMNEERLNAWTAEYNRVEKLYNKMLRGDAPEPTGDKKTDAYNFMFYNINKAKSASDRKEMKDYFTAGEMAREVYIKNDDIAESDPKYKEVYDELVALRKKLEPYDFKDLIAVPTFAESKAKWKGASEKNEAEKYNLFFDDKYSGADGAELKKLAKDAVTRKYSPTKIIHSNFKHGWVNNEEFSGSSVAGHNKTCRVMVFYMKDGKYYSCETFFKMQAPVGSNFTKTDWPGLPAPIEVPAEIFNREYKKAK